MIMEYNFSSAEEMERNICILPRLTNLFLAAEKNPYERGIWREVVQLARNEDCTPIFFGIPSTDLIEVGERIRRTKTLEGKYRILSERHSNGMLWYDIVMGGNQKGVNDLTSIIGRKRWFQGLDVGCGAGNSIRSIAKYSEGIYGLDIFPFLLKRAKDPPEFPRNATLVAGNAMGIPFCNQKFDLVYTNGLSAYFTDDELVKFYQEVIRILKPGGSYLESLGGQDKEVPTSGKKLLSCLIGAMIINRTKARPFSLIWKETFLKEGFELISYEMASASIGDVVQNVKISTFGFSQVRTVKRWVVEFRKIG